MDHLASPGAWAARNEMFGLDLDRVEHGHVAHYLD